MIHLGNTNGLVDNIYYYMWYKDDSIKEESFKVCIPDTIIFKNGMPQVWYFTSTSGEILMKKQEGKTEENIMKAFSKQIEDLDIIAYYIYPGKWNYSADEHYQPYIPQSEKKKELKQLKVNEKICIIYMNKLMLLQFLRDPTKSPDGILQKFVQPLGEHETLIQAIWSPSVCILSRRQNYRQLADERYDPYERCVTFDGAEVYSRTVPLRGREISNEIRRQAKMITQKITNISYEKINITRIVMYFKPDKNNHLWFLYASCLRTDQEDKIQIKNYQQQILKWKNNPCKSQNNTPVAICVNYELPFSIKQLSTTNTIHPVQLVKDIQCFDCEKLCQKYDLYHVPYSLIISTFAQNPNTNQKTNNKIKVAIVDINKRQPLVTREFIGEPQAKSSFIQDQEIRDIHSHIPPLILKYYPNLTIDLYERLSTNDRFLTKTILLCEHCFLKYSKTKSTITGSRPQKYQIDLDLFRKSLSTKVKLFQNEKLKKIVSQMNLELLQEKKQLKKVVSSGQDLSNDTALHRAQSFNNQSLNQPRLLSNATTQSNFIGSLKTSHSSGRLVKRPQSSALLYDTKIKSRKQFQSNFQSELDNSLDIENQVQGAQNQASRDIYFCKTSGRQQ